MNQISCSIIDTINGTENNMKILSDLIPNVIEDNRYQSDLILYNYDIFV